MHLPVECAQPLDAAKCRNFRLFDRTLNLATKNVGHLAITVELAGDLFFRGSVGRFGKYHRWRCCCRADGCNGDCGWLEAKQQQTRGAHADQCNEIRTETVGMYRAPELCEDKPRNGCQYCLTDRAPERRAQCSGSRFCRTGTEAENRGVND